LGGRTGDSLGRGDSAEGPESTDDSAGDGGDAAGGGGSTGGGGGGTRVVLGARTARGSGSPVTANVSVILERLLMAGHFGRSRI